MGLDMWLKRSNYVRNWEHDKFSHTVTVEFQKKGEKKKTKRPDINVKNVCAVVEEVMYWRKFNALHNYIVENFADGVDKCQRIDLEIGDIMKIRDVLKEVNEDHSKAEELLPTASGFFFGNTDYNDWYFNDVEKTLKVLNELIEEREVKEKFAKENDVYLSTDYYYQASW